MPNTGRKIFGTLTQVYVDTGLPTPTSTKSNSPTDVDYVQPVVDEVTCPIPPPVIPAINKISTQFINNNLQVIVLKTEVVRAESVVDLTFAYDKNDPLALFPLLSVTPTIHDQTDDLTRVQFIVSNLSFDLPVQLTIKYEKHSEGSPTTVFSQIVGKNDSINVSIPTPRESGSNTNLLTIIFDNL